MSVNLSDGEVVLDARALSVRDLTDAILAAFDADQLVAITGPAWKQSTIASIIDAICATTGTHGQWRYVPTEPTVVAEDPRPGRHAHAEPEPEPEAVPSGESPHDSRSDALADLQALAVLDDDAAATADDDAATDDIPTFTLEPLDKPAETAPAGVEQQEALDVEEQETADVERTEVISLTGSDSAAAEMFGGWADTPLQVQVESPAPVEPPLPDVVPLTGDTLAAATYAYAALLQPLSTAALRPLPASGTHVGPASDSAALAAMRDLADLASL